MVVADVGAVTERDLEDHRAELTGYCYRMLGSISDAEDAVQETLLRAWRAADRFEGRSSVRTWLYRIATNVCMDAMAGRQRRARPMDLGPSTTVAAAELGKLPHDRWLEPAPDRAVLPPVDDPALLAEAREGIRLAFVAALQHLPPRQRAVLILCEVLQWRAAEAAALLDTSVASVNSALQRARATLRAPERTDVLRPDDPAQRALLSRYLEAFERYDMDALATLLSADVVQSMPPFELWLRGRDEVIGWMLGPGAKCRGSRVLAVAANGAPAYAQWRAAEDGDGHEAWAVHVLDLVDGTVTAIGSFLDVDTLFPRFGLPLRLPAGAPLPVQP
jgi:RNA polymerase sigma-70 factor, ECF subfamily